MPERPTRTFVISDDLLSGQPPPTPPPDWVPPSIAESLERDSKDESAEFYLVDDKPCVVWPDLDLAYDYSVHPIREIHPFIVIRGTKIERETFIATVKRAHNL